MQNQVMVTGMCLGLWRGKMNSVLHNLDFNQIFMEQTSISEGSLAIMLSQDFEVGEH